VTGAAGQLLEVRTLTLPDRFLNRNDQIVFPLKYLWVQNITLVLAGNTEDYFLPDFALE
jgi:hypothetical protein